MPGPYKGRCGAAVGAGHGRPGHGRQRWRKSSNNKQRRKGPEPDPQRQRVTRRGPVNVDHVPTVEIVDRGAIVPAEIADRAVTGRVEIAGTAATADRAGSTVGAPRVRRKSSSTS